MYVSGSFSLFLPYKNTFKLIQFPKLNKVKSILSAKLLVHFKGILFIMDLQEMRKVTDYGIFDTSDLGTHVECVCVCVVNCVQLFATPWTLALQALLSMEFSRQEYWPFPPPGDLLHPGIEPMSPCTGGGLFTTCHLGGVWPKSKCGELALNTLRVRYPKEHHTGP